MPEVLEEAHAPQIELQEAAETVHHDSEHHSESISTIHFKLPAFEGPLDLLLHFIKSSKIDIYDIPIVEITQQYMEYIDFMKELNLEIAGDYLVMAATLIHIKSKMLLPVDEDESDEPVEDPRAELVKRLLEYQAFKESSLHLRKREDIWKHVFKRPVPESSDIDLGPEPVLTEANVFDLISMFQKLLARAPEQVMEVTRETLTVADRINFIAERMEREDGVRFEDLLEEGYTRIVLIVTFLAVLEMIRLGLTKLYQEQAFGTIWILRPKEGVDDAFTGEDAPVSESETADSPA
jgi:segregation and condensation protein A